MKKAVLAVVGTFVIGCGGSVGDEPLLSGVQVHNRLSLEASELYMDDTVSDAPVSRDEVADWGGAVSVRILVGPDVVAAIDANTSSGVRALGAWTAAPAGFNTQLETPAEIVEGNGVIESRTPPNPDLVSPTTGTGAAADPASATTSSAAETTQALPNEVTIDWSAPVQLTFKEVQELVLFHPGCV